ncbi:DExH-box splicing factor binding site domain containing protein [Russula decolorans]|jgi:hypothetical protein
MDLGPQSFTLTFQSNANQRSEPEGKVIAALKNGDWREIARKRRARAKMYIPPGAQSEASTNARAVGSSETINSGPSLVGLHKRKRTQVDTTQDVPAETESPLATEDVVTEDERAIRALIVDAEGGDGTEGATADIIPMANSSRPAPTEDDAFKADVEDLPNEATLQDYERMPVSQFGAALLRGMGWKPGEPASRNKNRGIVEPWLPSARPALLGIGAKEREIFDDGSGRSRSTPSRPDRKYKPLLRVESGRASPRSQPASRSESRRPSRSPPRKERREDDRDRRRDLDRQRERERDGRYDRHRESERDRDWDRRRDRERSPRPSRRDRDRDHRDR